MHHLQTAILYSAILIVTVHVLSVSASNIDRSFPCFNCHVPREGFEPPRNGSGPFSLSVSLTRYVEQYVIPHLRLYPLIVTKFIALLLIGYRQRISVLPDT